MTTYEFRLICDKNKNYTPANLMERYAKNNNLKIGYTPYFNTYIEIKGKYYIYDYWKIESLGISQDIVRVFLKEITLN